ncbi:poly [ADP-ribose] polymerase 1-like [Bolinopsis microptera]|uniref:poly [ADP-ribose] polymerase 1-like n=1 Tax=Bolinopsis microptera TaxID=2820187 RepID=UPI00307AC2F6
MALWNHFNCFFRKNSVKSTGDIKGFGTLRYEDQAKIKEKIGGGGVASTGKGKEVSVDVAAEYAKSNRSTCNGCFVSIDKDTVRIGCWVAAEGKELKWAVGGRKQVWHHPTCFSERKKQLDIDHNITADIIDGYELLKKEDQAQLVLLLGKGGKKKKRSRKSDNNENMPPPQSALEKKLQAQSGYLMEIRQALKEVNNKYLREMLEYNGYPTHGADIRLIDRCSDGIAFGRFDEPCSVCDGTYFSLGESSYVCKGDVSEFTKCSNIIPQPKRTKWIIPESVMDQSDYLATLKLKTGLRIDFKVLKFFIFSSYSLN